MPRQNNIQFRKGSSSQWISQNPTLASGEPGYDLSNKILKVGDGTSTWTQLSGINQNIVAGYDISVTNTSGIYTIASTNLVHTDSQQPQGFVNRTDSRISVSGNVFRIEPTGSSYSYYNKGIKVVKTSGDSLTIPNLTQINYIHFDTINNQISNKTTSFDFSSDIPIAYVAWNSGVGPSGQMTFFAEERHGIVMDTSTHKWIHNTFGAQYVDGLSISNYSTSGNGSSNSHATISIGNGTLYQEDIEINITDSSSSDPFCQELSPIAQIPVYYHEGSTGQWVKNTATNYPVKYDVNGPQYNLLTGGTWTIPYVSTGGHTRYFAVWILATNQIDDPIISIMGQRVDSNQGSAESNNSWSDVNLTNLPLSEVKPLYRLIFAGDSDYTNVPKCTLLSILDIRVSVISTIAGVTQNDHGNLFGLGDDDHSQYLHIDNNRTVNAIHNFVNGINLTNNQGTLNVINDSGGLSINFGGSETYNFGPSIAAFDNSISAFGGNFVNNLTVNGTGVSISGHTHTSSNITDFNSSVSGLLPVGTANYLSKFGTGGSGLSNSLIFDNGTNVGIGTVTPQSKVHITDTNDLNTTIEYTNTTAGFASGVRPLKLLLTGSNGVGVGAGVGIDFVTKSSSTEYTGARIVSNRTDTSNNHALTFWAGGGTTSLSEYMRISSNGNVGIGISSPSHKLHVSGVIRSTSYITSDTEFRLNNLAFARVATMDGGGGFAGGYNVYLSGSMPKHNSVGALSSYYYSSDGTIRFYTNSSQSADTDASERLRITSAGNVGIRTTSPESSLTINTTIGSSSNINSTAGYAFGIHHSGMRITSPEDTSTNPNYPLINLLVSRPGGHQGGTASIDFDSRDRGNATNRGIMARILGGNAPNTAANTSGGGYLSLEVAPTGSTTPISRIAIINNGNVGIGTATPSYALNVNPASNSNNGIQILNNSAGTSARSLLSLYNGSYGAEISLGGTGFTSDGFYRQNRLLISAPFITDYVTGQHYFHIGGGGTYQAVSGSTQVGVWDINALTLQNELRPTAGIAGGTLVGSSLTLKSTTNVGTTDHIKLVVGNNGATEAVRVINNGNVGIGTTTPTYKLQVNGSFAASTKSFRIDHPSKKDHSLEYGSLESPYHGVRLTGRGTVIKGVGTVSLPSYLKDLIHDDDTLNIQITNIKHGKTIYIDKIDLQNDRFIVKVDRAKSLGELQFCWTLTGVRKDVDHLVVEKEN
jgi:hypothetical protein